ncbi:MAG: hypothetical protein CMM49_08360 [Rhodospirillaceae bacterium]|nr:hypothetical protein [Rhodospirillaceae bacterium]|tara:strand:- start:2325 stop:3071 length:747 start_codon:yes stop_codon:yes gene_type:complete
MMQIFLIIIYLLIFLLPTRSSGNETLNTEISQKTISISSNFTGKKILLFGNKEIEGDIIITISGPKEKVLVHEKTKKMGIWINSNKIVFSDVPSYYAIASNRRIKNIISIENQNKLQIGAERLNIKPINNLEISNEEIEKFKSGLIRNKIKKNLYSLNEKSVFFNNKLFRSQINFPTNAPEGNYKINTYLIKNNNIINSKENSVFISKVGIERKIYNFANKQPALYGICAIIIAILSGSIASIIFRRI